MPHICNKVVYYRLYNTITAVGEADFGVGDVDGGADGGADGGVAGDVAGGGGDADIEGGVGGDTDIGVDGADGGVGADGAEIMGLWVVHSAPDPGLEQQPG